MMNRSMVFRILMALILVAGIAALGFWAYSLGVAQGMTGNPNVSGAVVPYSMPIYPFYGFPFFGFLLCLVPFFFFGVVCFAFRGLFWRGPRHWGHYYPGPGSKEWKDNGEGWVRGARSVFDQWHTEAHTEKSEPKDTQP